MKVQQSGSGSERLPKLELPILPYEAPQKDVVQHLQSHFSFEKWNLLVSRGRENVSSRMIDDMRRAVGPSCHEDNFTPGDRRVSDTRTAEKREQARLLLRRH